MKIIYLEKLKGSPYEEPVLQLLQSADGEFIPPLSARGSTTQQDLHAARSVPSGVLDYFHTMAPQPILLAVDEDTVTGFMSFKKDYQCEEVTNLPNLYASTCVVAPSARGQGLMEGFYREMLRLFPRCHIYTRTWHTNFAHIRVLEKLGFSLCARLQNHRAPGLDTVYYTRSQ